MTTSEESYARVTTAHWGWLAAFCLVAAAAYGPVLAGMAADWAQDDNYSHGFLVPLVSAYALWIHRRRLGELVWRPTWFGLGVVLLGVIILVLGEVGAEQFTKRVSFLIVVGGGILFLLGMPALRRLSFPYAYLFFMVPLPYIVYDSVAFPLKLMAARVATGVVLAMGIPIYAEGNVIYLESTTLQVADACSGIRSLVSLLALAAAFAYLTQRGTARRWILTLAAIPIAIFTNMMRIVGTAFLTHYYGVEMAMGFFHEFAGLAVFGTALVMLFALGLALQWAGRWMAAPGGRG
ncbi:MAG: exosortase/archaeosortase family protein [Nitrospirota bacterium]|jgi:exosortase